MSSLGRFDRFNAAELKMACQIQTWALSPAAAEVDINLALVVRLEWRRDFPDWDRLWVACCRLVLKNASPTNDLEEEPLVSFAQKLLDSSLVSPSPEGLR